MSDSMTVTELRSKLYRVIDQVLATGRPQRIRRGGRSVLLQPDGEGPRLRLDKLPRRQAISCTPDELIEQGFEDEWQGEL